MKRYQLCCWTYSDRVAHTTRRLAMYRDILRITTEGRNVVFHPIKRHSLVSESCIVTGKRC